MTNPAFSYNLSYFRPNKESSVEIKINTNGQETNGFQLIIDVASDPKMNIVDQNSSLEYPQLSIASIENLSFLTNKAIPTETGYQIVIAAITSNPKESFSTNIDTTVASLIFTQPSEGEIIISNNDELTKISTLSLGNKSAESPTISKPIAILTESVGTEPTYLEGEIYSPPAPSEITTSAVSDDQPVNSGSISTSIMVGVIVVLVALIGAIIFLIKKLNKKSEMPPTQNMTPAAPPQDPPLTTPAVTPPQTQSNPTPPPLAPPITPIREFPQVSDPSQSVNPPKVPTPTYTGQPLPTNPKEQQNS